MLALIAGWLFHPYGGTGYQFWSGIGSDIGEIAIIGAIFGWWHSHHCHVHRCLRIAWHPDPVHGHPVCRHHHPDTGRIVPDPNGGTMRIEKEKKIRRG